ncbi:DNA polymerase [Bacillus pseudomycoides]|uniref:DNA polymerase I n=1 Tax=Bacillus pseudomycoides TaxID=64104 RepID=A0A2A8BYJ7_9BACI|nr:DNA polymerase [Bacillus pseudomycoides]PEM65277.1 DNA polymerase [Bacillus pseudomycoides]
MDFNFYFEEETTQAKDVAARIKAAEAKKQAAKYQPTWEEVWNTGYETHTGKRKNGIFQSKNSAPDEKRLREVKQAIENDELGKGVEDMKKFTKAHALRLHKELAESRRESLLEEMVINTPENYHLIDTYEALDRLIADLENEPIIAIDTETTGLDYFNDVIVGMSLTLPLMDYHVYIPFEHDDCENLNRGKVFKKMKHILESDVFKKVYFNAKFDIHMFRRHGVKMGGFLFDGFIAMKLLNDNEMSYALKNLSTKYGKFFGFVDDSATYEELFGKNTPFSKVKTDVALVYAAKDTHLTWKFYKWILSHFERLPGIKGLYMDIERPITEVCVAMEQAGFEIDMEFAKEYGDELNGQLSVIESQLFEYFGDVNLNSPSQLQVLFYDDLGLDDVSGKRSTDKKTLKKLSRQHKGIALLLEYRDIKKLLSTYVEALPNKVKHDGRLHGQFNQVDTATGRFASKEPNLQNLPPRARRLIVAGKGSIILGVDYSQIEPRTLAHLSGDEELIRAYVEQRDLYIEMAMKVFKLTYEYCVDGAYDPTGTFQPRKAVKSILLGIMYGMGSKTLSENVGVSQETAEQYIDDFFEAYPKVKKFIDETHDFADKNEYVETMYGRKRRFPKHAEIAKRYRAVLKKVVHKLGREPKFIWNEKLPYKLKQEFWDVSGLYSIVARQTVNTRIQGSAADILKKAMIKVHAYCERRTEETGRIYRILATVHDELLIEVPEDISREEIHFIEGLMKNIVNLRTPMKVDAEIIQRYGEGMDVDSWFTFLEQGHVEREMKGKTETYNGITLTWEVQHG